MSAMITVTDVRKKYKDFVAVDGISFTVNRGEIFAFLGPNGAGKTTTIKMLTTLLKPTEGTLNIDGLDPVTQPNDLRRLFGIVFQDPSLDDELTAYENMEFHAVLYGMGAKERRPRIESLLEFVELLDRQNALVKTFSGGMKRRLEIARGLLHEPKMLFLDEPTLGLDPQTRNHIWKYIKDLRRDKGVSVMFTTHYMQEAEDAADRVAIIDHGKIIALGTVDEIKKSANATSLEQAFLALTGKNIRDEHASAADAMRQHGRAWGRR